MQTEAQHVDEQMDDEQFGPQLINKLEVSLPSAYARPVYLSLLKHLVMDP